ncbi:dephospho-CoA kinase [Candidatus Omnitrophota bacterium]
MVIGVTGSFGSGKSFVAKMFAQRGAYIVDADGICHSLMKPSKKAYKKVLRHFGRSILKKDKTIDRKRLAGIVFEKGGEIKLLNRLVHPEVIKEMVRLIRTNKKNALIVVDGPLLVETGFYKKMDRLIVVKTGRHIQTNRMIKAKGMSRNEVLDRIRMQAPLKKKLALADFVIDNSGSKKETLSQVEKIWKTISLSA